MSDATLITGASSGLGADFARALAADGQDLVLVARRLDRLEALAGELAAKHGIAAHAIAADLSAPDAVATLMEAVAAKGLTIGTLINNAGYGARGAFAELDGKRQSDMIRLNCIALTEICHAVLPVMIARRSGGILNVASTAAFQAGPNMAVYYATKAFVLSFSEALHEEVKPQGVHVAALCPGATRTEFGDAADMTDSLLFRMAGPPDAVVRDGLAALKANRAVKVSGFLNAAMAQSVRMTPRFLTRRIAQRLQS